MKLFRVGQLPDNLGLEFQVQLVEPALVAQCSGGKFMVQDFTVFCFKHLIDIHRVETYADDYFHGPTPDLIFPDYEPETREVILSGDFPGSGFFVHRFKEHRAEP